MRLPWPAADVVVADDAQQINLGLTLYWIVRFGIFEDAVRRFLRVANLPETAR